MRKVLSVFGMLSAVAMIVVGIVFLTGSNDAEYVKLDSVSPEQSGTYYDSGFASFGGDYYTYSVNNAYIAAKNAYEAARMSAAAANRISVVTDQIAAQTRLLRTVSGTAMLFFGLFGLFGFAIVLTKSKKAKHEIAGAYAVAPSLRPVPPPVQPTPVYPAPVYQNAPTVPPVAAVPQEEPAEVFSGPETNDALMDTAKASTVSAPRPDVWTQ